MTTETVIVYRSCAEQAVDQVLSSADAFSYMVAAFVFVAVFALVENTLPKASMYTGGGWKRQYAVGARQLVALALALTAAVCTVLYM